MVWRITLATVVMGIVVVVVVVHGEASLKWRNISRKYHISFVLK